MLTSGWRSRLNESLIKKATDAYLKSEAVPFLTSAHISKSDDFVQISSTWCQPSIVSGKRRMFSRTYGISSSSSKPIFQSSPLPFEASESILTYSGDQSVNQFVIYKSKNAKGDDMFVLESWNPDGLQKSYNLTDLDLHGPVYFDDEFGSLAVNKSGTKLAYIAEEKRPKSVPFFKKNGNGGPKGDSQPEVGTEYSYVEEWGEQMVSKSQPVVVTLNLTDDNMKVWSRGDDIPSSISPGHLSFIGDDIIVGIATQNEPRRLGIVYCSNRPSVVFQMSVADHLDESKNRYKKLGTTSNVHCKYPRVSPDEKQLIWLERDLAFKFPGPHQACYRLMALDLQSTDANAREVVPVVKHHEFGVDSFSGIFGDLPKQCFLSNLEIMFTNPLVDTDYPVVVDLQSGNVSVLKDHPHVDILAVGQGFIVGAKSTPTEAPSISIGRYEFSSKKLELFSSVETKSKSSASIWKSYVHTAKEGHPDATYEKVKFNSIYVGPESGAQESVPLIVWPHGGPHSLILTTFMREVMFFQELGYAVLFVNFRGSIGAGQDSVDSLLGHVGDTDVKDCRQALDECLETNPCLNPDKVVLLGGSHGGFLVTHLAGQYPNTFKAVVARNPVINIASMAASTDIPDWCANEAGLNFDFLSPTPDALKLMYEKSPIFHAKNIEAPVFLMIGKVDLRVPPSQGHEFYHHLKALGKEVYMNVYDDNHPLSKLPNHSNVFINAALFYDYVLNTKS